MAYLLALIFIILFAIFAIFSIAVSLGGGLFVGIFPSIFFAIRNYITSVRDNVSNKGVSIIIHIAFYLLITAFLLAAVVATLYLFGINIFQILGISFKTAINTLGGLF